jgi:signal transduction histidine kinase
MGLRNMQARAQQVGGTFRVQTEPGAGTSIVVTVPEGAK